MARDATSGAPLPGPPTRPGRRALAALCCAGLAAVAVGFAAKSGGGDGGGVAPAPAAVSACAPTGNSVERPAEVPAEVLPPGTALTSVAHPATGMTLVTGVVSQEFRSAVDFFVTKMPAAGYRLGAGDAEMDEAEAFFTGPNVRGKWKVNGISNCAGAVTLALYVKT